MIVQFFSFFLFFLGDFIRGSLSQVGSAADASVSKHRSRPGSSPARWHVTPAIRAPCSTRGSLNTPASSRLYHNTNPSRSQTKIFSRSPDRTTFSIPIELRRYRISLASAPREASARVWTEPTLWKRSTLRGSSQGAMPRVTRLDVRCLVVLGDVARTAPTRSGIVERASDHFAGSLT